MSEDLKLGQKLEAYGVEKKDAIHIALVPARAATDLKPGQHVGPVGNGLVGGGVNAVGIVDPFLREDVKKNERFWLFLYPGSIRSLRHEWTHPLFQGDVPVVSEEEKRLREFAEESYMNYEQLLEAARSYLEYGDYVIEGSRYEGWSTYNGFWDDYEQVTQCKVPDAERGSFFSCSC